MDDNIPGRVMAYFKDYQLIAADREAGAKLFSGSWVTDYSSIGLPDTGKAQLLNDWRIRWLAEQIGGLRNMDVLELGSFEGAHTLTFANMGVNFCTAIEANAQHFMKSCYIKNYANINNIQFLLGDFIGYLEKNTRNYDIISACGVLYHMTDPARLIRSASRTASRLFIWTVVYDEARLPASVRPHLSEKITMDSDGFRYEGYKHQYQENSALKLHSQGLFSGGSENYSTWLELGELRRILSYYGFVVKAEKINEEPNPLHGSNVVMVAESGGR